MRSENENRYDLKRKNKSKKSHDNNNDSKNTVRGLFFFLLDRKGMLGNYTDNIKKRQDKAHTHTHPQKPPPPLFPLHPWEVGKKPQRNVEVMMDELNVDG